MRTLLTHLSALAALMVFLNRMRLEASIETAVLSALAAGVPVYLVLLVGDTLVHRIASRRPAAAAGDAAPEDEPVGTEEFAP